MGRTFRDREFAPEPSFNGTIRLKITYCLSDKQLVEQHLEVMRNRF